MLFPTLTPEYLLSFQFSCWYPKFSHITIKSHIIRPLSREFCEYLDSDSVFVPEGSEDVPVESSLSDDDDDEEDDANEEDEQIRQFAFPDLDAQIREIIKRYGAVFPKLNFSSPKDASWILPASSPLKCTSPADVYLLLKSSDFVSNDLDRDTVFHGCDYTPDDANASALPPYELELVLRKWYPIDRGRELRCFVRNEILLGISQRDTNYYEYLSDSATQDAITTAVTGFWETNIKGKTGNRDYTFDIVLTRDLSRAHVLDFNPYAPRTDPLLFTYDVLLFLLADDAARRPRLMVINSAHHPAANRAAPEHQHNMIPFEALTLSNGKDIQEFADAWYDEVKKAAQE